VHGAVFRCTAGDILDYAPATMREPKIAALKSNGIFEVLGYMKYDAIALGETDFAAGPAFLREMKQKHSLPLICANAYDKAKGERFFDPYVISEKDGVRVAFIGIISPERHITSQVDSELIANKVDFRDPSEELAKILPEVKQKSDVVILLSHTGIETAEFLAKDLKGVDALIVGHFPAIENDPRKIGDTIFAMAGSKSDRFGTLELTLKADGSGVEAFEGDAIRLLKTGPEVPEIAAIAEQVDKAEKEINRERQLAMQRDNESKRLMAQSDKVHSAGGYLGAESCKSCHQPTYDSWLKTPHAEAFSALAEQDAWDDPECVGCHVTGQTDKHHAAEANVAPERWNVQCEECHGSGLAHARDGSYVTSGEATCLKCHDTQNSPEFEFKLYSSYGVH
jgi:2',3'-cyclic-nucleotide 2'-phosphodiesterase (5'-nucleotidase family)